MNTLRNGSKPRPDRRKTLPPDTPGGEGGRSRIAPLCDDRHMLRNGPDRSGPRVGAAQPFGPAAAVSRRAADRLRAGHLWVYRSDAEVFVPLTGATGIA